MERKPPAELRDDLEELRRRALEIHDAQIRLMNSAQEILDAEAWSPLELQAAVDGGVRWALAVVGGESGGMFTFEDVAAEIQKAIDVLDFALAREPARA